MADRVAKYEILKSTVRGGRVYHAAREKSGLRRDVTLVDAAPEVLNDPVEYQDFQRECRLLAKLSGEDEVIDVYGEEEDGGTTYLVMERMESSLEELMAEARQPRRVRGIMMRLLRALERMHAHGLIHGVLSPASIWQSDHLNQIKLGDVGLALKIGDEHADLPEWKLNSQYMAPEVMEPTLKNSPAADVYSVGMIAYEMLLGRERFEAQFPDIYDGDELRRPDRWDAWHQLLDVRVTPLHLIDANFDPGLSAAIAGFMEKRVENRTPTAAAARAALEGLDRPQQVPVGGPSHVEVQVSAPSESAPIESAAPWWDYRAWSTRQWYAGLGVLVLLVAVLSFSFAAERNARLQAAAESAQTAALEAETAARAAGAHTSPPLPEWNEARNAHDAGNTEFADSNWEQSAAAFTAASTAYGRSVVAVRAREKVRGALAARRAPAHAARERYPRGEAEALKLTAFVTAERTWTDAEQGLDGPHFVRDQAQIGELYDAATTAFEAAQRAWAARKSELDALRDAVGRAFEEANRARADAEAVAAGPMEPSFAEAQSRYDAGSAHQRDLDIETSGPNAIAAFEAAALLFGKAAREKIAFAEIRSLEASVQAVRDKAADAGADLEMPDFRAATQAQAKARALMQPPNYVLDVLVQVRSELKTARAGFEASLLSMTQSLERLFGDARPEFVELEGGCFKLARRPGKAEICVAAFKMSVHEVTVAQYRLFAEATRRTLTRPRGCETDDCPVVEVSWDDANQFAAWLSEQTRREFRLPTEAQWEWALRDGRSGLPPPLSIEKDTAIKPVGSAAPNSAGIVDLLGNVWEITCSSADAPNKCVPPLDDAARSALKQKRRPEGRAPPPRIHIRGGSNWVWDEPILPHRHDLADWNRQLADVGFRLVQTD